MDDGDYRAMGLLPPPARRAVPGPCQTVAEILDPQLAQDRQALALIGRHCRLSYGELDAAANAAAAALQEYGIGKGDRVAMSLANHPEIVIAFLAVQRLGAIWVGINLALAPAEKLRLLDDADPALLIAEPRTCAELAALGAHVAVLEVEPGHPSQWHEALARHADANRPAVQINPFAPAAIAYTSGTTGNPKGAVHSQHNLCVVAEARLQEIPEQTGKVDGVALPLTILNLMILGPLCSLRRGGVSVCIDTLHPSALARRITEEGIGSMQMAPPTLYDLLHDPAIALEDLAPLVSPGVGGAHVQDALRDRYAELFGREAVFGYGLTEAPTALAATRAGRPRRMGSSGLPLAHVEIGILSPRGAMLGTGEQGEICARAGGSGPWAEVYTPMLGYWRRPEATAEALRGGWLHTGDIGLIDETGELHVKDRAKDLILRGGANVYPVEVERVILTVPGVAACSVLGMADERLGERVVAAIEIAPDEPADDVVARARAICGAALARYKQPEQWHVVTALPRNAMGKVVKAALAVELGRSPRAADNRGGAAS